MKNKFLVISFIFIAFFTYKSHSQGLGGDVYMIGFTDKNNNGFSIDVPQAFLSERAIQRRLTRNISISENDLPLTSSYISQVAATGATVIGKSKWLNSIIVLLSSPQQLSDITQLPFVVSNTQLNRSSSLISDDNKFNLETNVSLAHAQNRVAESSAFDYGQGYQQINMIGGMQLHQNGYRGQGMLIAVLDAGFPGVDFIAGFDSLRNENRIISTYDFVGRSPFVYSYNSHGTSTLSCMAALSPGSFIGTAPKASYILLRTENATPESKSEEFYWVEGAEYADSCGADVINSSLGYTTFDNAAINYTRANLDGNTAICTRGADVAASKGILVVNSAGNSGGNSWQKLGAPADGDSVFCIGGVTSNLTRASFSSYGPTADDRLKPDVAALAVGATIFNQNGSVGGANGTSFSCPIIAGMSACLWQANPTYSNMELIEAIKSTSSQFSNPDTSLGWGIPNFSAADFILQGKKLEQYPTAENILLSPNPFTDNLNFNFYSADTQSFRIVISDALGKKVFENNYFALSKSYNQLNIPIAQSLSKGIYFFSLSTPEKVYTRKIIKN
jgi:serine protease AprX